MEPSALKRPESQFKHSDRAIPLCDARIGLMPRNVDISVEFSFASNLAVLVCLSSIQGPAQTISGAGHWDEDAAHTIVLRSPFLQQSPPFQSFHCVRPYPRNAECGF